MYVLHGALDHRDERRGMYVRLGASKCVPDTELHGGGGFFNPDRRECNTIDDCVNQWDARDAAQTRMPEVPPLEQPPWFPPPMTLDDAHTWVAVLVATLLKPDPTGLAVIWAWEAIGNFWKSRCTNYMQRMLGAMATSASLSDADFGNQIKGYIAVHGVGPKCIIIDKPRDDSGEDSGINWKMVENMKNGMVVNTKWAVTEHDWQSPQVIIFSNDPRGPRKTTSAPRSRPTSSSALNSVTSPSSSTPARRWRQRPSRTHSTVTTWD